MIPLRMMALLSDMSDELVYRRLLYRPNHR
jgi:hypothetical protein